MEIPSNAIWIECCRGWIKIDIKRFIYYDMEDLILFTHIPKTSGTSLLKELIEPNLAPDRIFRNGNIKKIVPALHKNYQLISGHFAYGLHFFSPQKVKYITFLREPTERAISFYYFVQQGKDNPVTRHPLCDYAESVSLQEFYQNKQFHNHQTRMTAGWLEHKLYKYLDSPKNQQLILTKAINNLKNNYYYYGLLEEREKSVAFCQKKFNWHNYQTVKPQKKTYKRARVDDVDLKTLKTIQAANALDIEFYNFALEHFNSLVSI